MLVTIFKNIFELSEPFHTDDSIILKRIKDGNSRELVEAIRAEWEKEGQSKLKKKLPSICFSGQFSERDDNKLLEHSGLICLDIDSINTDNLEEVRQLLEADRFVYSCFISPGGAGFKILVRILADHETHLNQFLSLEKYYNKILERFTSTAENIRKLRDGKTKKIDPDQGEFLRVHIDPSGKNVSRVCYESYDPEIYFNAESEVYTDIHVEEKIEASGASEMEIIEGLEKWIEKNDSYYEGNRNQYLYKFASALCNYGIVQDSAEGFILSNYDLEEREIKATVRSAYKGNEFAIKKFEKFEGKAGPKMQSKAPEVKKKNVTSFWFVNDKGRAIIDPIKFIPFLQACGFFTYRIPGDVEGVQFVKVSNMIVEIVGVIDIKRIAIDYVKKFAPVPVVNELMLKARYFEKSFLNALKEIEVNQVRDGMNFSYAFFDGFYYEIRKDKVEKKNYIDLKGVHIWRSHLCKKNITAIDPDFEKHDFAKFIFRAMGEKQNKYESIKTSIGYMVHNYKLQSLTKLVYFSDESFGELDGEANGGTGKDLALKCLDLIRNVVYIDGKDFDKRDRFKFQSVKPDSQNVIFNDYEGDINELFTKVTGHFSMQRKGKDEIQLDFEEAPKLAITSNQSPRGFSRSFRRRTNSVEFSSYYNLDLRPIDEFKRDFFSSQWTQKDYNAIYTFLFHCVKLYLNVGLKEIVSDVSKEKQLVRNTSKTFAEWYNESEFDFHDNFNGRNVFENYRNETEDGELRIQDFYKYFRITAEIFGFKFQQTNARRGRDREFCLIR